MDRFSQFALLAADEAIMSSGLKNSQETWSENAGIILGSSIGGIETINNSYKQVFEEGHNRLHPLTIPKIMNNSCSKFNFDRIQNTRPKLYGLFGLFFSQPCNGLGLRNYKIKKIKYYDHRWK